MGQTDAERVYNTEERQTFRSFILSEILSEIDSMITCKDVWSTITRTTGLISKVEYFSDAAKTKKIVERNFSRITGYAGISYVSTITTIFYNDNGSEDSRVTTTISRDTTPNKNVIQGCGSPFSTGEVGPC